MRYEWIGPRAAIVPALGHQKVRPGEIVEGDLVGPYWSPVDSAEGFIDGWLGALGHSEDTE